MPILGRRTAEDSGARSAPWLPVCANEHCASSRLQIWRNRRTPFIEGGWVCSPACTEARLCMLLRREHRAQSDQPETHRHRVPLGLVLLAENWIMRDDLRAALEAQRNGCGQRIGSWLVENRGLEEQRVTQALSIQWGCPIFTAKSMSAVPMVPLVPRLFLDSYDCFPLRISSVSSTLYLAFEDRIDHSLALAVERMTGFKVEAGLMSSSIFLPARERALRGRFPRARIMEAASVDVLTQSISRLIEREKPAEVKVVRLHDLYWFRLWKTASAEQASRTAHALDSFEDVLCSIGGIS